MIINLFKVFAPLAISFFIGIAITPLLTHYLYKHKMWKKRSGKVDPSGNNTPIFNELHKHKEVGTPRMGGVIIWVSAFITIFLFWLLSKVFPGDITEKLSFLSRNQTWLPLFTLIAASIIGLIDDWLEVSGNGKYVAGGLPFIQRLMLVIILGLIGAWWFYFKLDVFEITIPFWGLINIGLWSIPLFVVAMVGLFTSGVIDGLDGLAGGVMTIIFVSYAVIAFAQGQVDLAAFCAVVAGGTLAFLWFNIPPARFYMSETGILGLTTTLTVVAFLTDTIIVLPLIALPLTVTVLGNVIQMSSKKLFQRKVFRVAPIHHHFEAIGWPSYKVVMRYWVISIIAAIIGIIIVLISR
jgi:phospho-N-acetylmuramoyl-pentapeptide-transferase